jgi:hypothetical protein
MVVFISLNDRAQALAADAAFCFGRGSKGDCVRIVAAAAAIGAARVADDAIASDSSCSDGASSECIQGEAQKSAPLRILQLIQVNHPCRGPFSLRLKYFETDFVRELLLLSISPVAVCLSLLRKRFRCACTPLCARQRSLVHSHSVGAAPGVCKR